MSCWPTVIAVAAPAEAVNEQLLSWLESAAVEDFAGALCFARGADRCLVVPDPEYAGGNELAGRLSAALAAPVLAVDMIEETVWGYDFFVDGELCDQFVTWPEEEGLPTGGDARLLATHWPEARPEELAAYLVDHSTCAHVELAVPTFPDDEFPRWSGWQFCDFLRRLGVPYPESDEAPLGGWEAEA